MPSKQLSKNTSAMAVLPLLLQLGPAISVLKYVPSWGLKAMMGRCSPFNLMYSIWAAEVSELGAAMGLLPAAMCTSV